MFEELKYQIVDHIGLIKQPTLIKKQIDSINKTIKEISKNNHYDLD